MVMSPLPVKWYGPYSFVETKEENVFTSLIGENKGLYLFTTPFEGEYLVYYVGETGASFSIRMLQHVQSYLNGFYRVFDPEEFARARKFFFGAECGKLTEKSQNLFVNFFKKIRSLRQKSLALLSNLEFF